MSDTCGAPVYFGSPERPLFGWLHQPPADVPARLAVVLCNPFGHEALSTYRPLRELAALAASEGMLALRFDYEGTGNSAGETHDVRDAASWRNNVSSALEYARNIAPGVPTAIVGVRLGALIALDAAARTDNIAAMVLIAPPKNGKQFLREMRALQATNSLLLPDHNGERADDAASFSVSGKLREWIDSLSLDGAKLPSIGRLFVVDRDDLPLGARIESSLRARHDNVEIKSLPGVAALLVEPHEVTPPRLIMQQTLKWLQSVACASQIKQSILRANTCNVAPAAVSVDAPTPRVKESAVFLDPERRLFGVLAEPIQDAGPRRAALILVSSGTVPTVGPNRVYVSIARRLAAEGVPVLRFDIAGVGDSEPHPGDAENVVYTDRAANDVSAALAYMRALGYSSIVAGGICAGGYHALKAAVAGASLTAVAIINPLTFHYVDGMPVAAQPHSTIVEVQRHRRSIRSAAAWRKLLTGKVGIGRTLSARGTMLKSWALGHARDFTRHTRWRRTDDVGYEFELLANRGVQIHLIFAADDPGPQLLTDFGGSAARRLEHAGALRITTIAGADHTFTAIRCQKVLGDVLAGHFKPNDARLSMAAQRANRHAFC